MMRQALFGFVLLLLSCGQALAQWLYTSQEDPFDSSKTLHMSVTASDGYFFGFSCRPNVLNQLVYMTTEPYKDEFASALALKPKLRVRIDDQPIVDLEMAIDEVKGKARIVADGDTAVDIARAIAAAKKRVAVAVEMGGMRFHTVSFGVLNSRTAITKALIGCGLTR